jgi:hypothetical protein
MQLIKVQSANSSTDCEQPKSTRATLAAQASLETHLQLPVATHQYEVCLHFSAEQKYPEIKGFIEDPRINHEIQKTWRLGLPELKLSLAVHFLNCA